MNFKPILIKNQYPPSFFEKIIHDTLTNILKPEEKVTEKESENDQNDIPPVQRKMQ